MATLQERIHELLIYTQLASGDSNYVDPATIWVPVDNNGWTKPKKITLAELMQVSHIETASVDPGSTSVSVTYDSAFSTSNYYFAKLQVWKEVTLGGSRTIRQEIPYYDLVTTVNGFSLTLEEYTAGMTLTYYAIETDVQSLFAKDYIYATGVAAGVVVPNSDKVQITGFTSVINRGITEASDEFTVARTGIYDIEISFATFNASASNVISIDVYNDVPAALGITRQFKPIVADDYLNFGVRGLLSLSENDVVRFYLSASGTGLTVSLSTVTVNIKQL